MGFMAFEARSRCLIQHEAKSSAVSATQQPPCAINSIRDCYPTYSNIYYGNMYYTHTYTHIHIPPVPS